MWIIVQPMELRLSAFIIGVLELIWAASITFDGGGRLANMLQMYQLHEEFSSLMALSSMFILLGSIMPCRAIRHVGLWITPIIMFPAFGLLVDNNITSAASFSLPFIGMMALFVYYMDVRGKPRAEKMDS